MPLNPVSIPPIDPQIGVFTPTRSVQGIVKCRQSTFDVDFDEYSRWICTDTDGALSYVGWDGVTVVIPSLISGVFHPIYAKRINSSGTDSEVVMWGN